MFLQLSAIIVDADNTNRHELAGFLKERGVSVHQSLPGVEELKVALQRGEPPQVVLVNVDPTAADTLGAAGALPRQYPQTAFFVMSQLMDPALLMRAMSLGFREFIPLPMTEQTLVEALQRVATAAGSGRRAKFITVVPTVGGVGGTTVACNIAASLAAKGNKTCLVDLDLVRGGVASSFDVRPTYTVADVMNSGDRVDQQLVENALIRYGKGDLRILARPELPEETQRVTQQGVNALFAVLGRMFDFVVLDSMLSVDPVYSTALMSSDVTTVVMQLNVPSAKNAERYVGAMRRMGIESTRIKVLVNRFVKKGCDIEPGEVERALGIQIGWTVPNDYKSAIGAINYGEPVVLRTPRSEMSQSLSGYAAAISDAKALKAAA